MQTIKQKVWKIINKEFGKSPQYEQEIAYWKRKNNKPPKGTGSAKHPPSPPLRIAYELLNQNSSRFNCQMSHQKIHFRVYHPRCVCITREGSN